MQEYVWDNHRWIAKDDTVLDSGSVQLILLFGDMSK